MLDDVIKLNESITASDACSSSGFSGSRLLGKLLIDDIMLDVTAQTSLHVFILRLHVSVLIDI